MKIKIGQVFERLEVLSESPKVRKYVKMWTCKCACGVETKVSQTHLLSRHTKSCGCLQKDSTRVPDAGFRGLLQQYKAGALSRGLEWSLTEEEFKTLTSSACYYTDRKTSQKFISSDTHRRRRLFGLEPNPGGVYFYNGVDRLDNSKGYTVENCVSCCEEANFAKGSRLDKYQFINLCKEVAQKYS